MSNPTGWAAPKINWATSDGIGTADLNKIGTNANATETGNRTVDQTQNPADNTASLQDYIDESAHQLNAIIGKTNWYDVPAKTINLISLAQDELVNSFEVSGNAAAGADYTHLNYFISLQQIVCKIPTMKSLIVRRARYFVADANTRLAVGVPATYIVVTYDNRVGTFAPGDNITNTTRTGTGVVVWQNGLNTIFVLNLKSGSFENNDSFGNGVGASADVDGAPPATENYHPEWVSAGAKGDETLVAANVIASNLTGGAVDQVVSVGLYDEFEVVPVATIADGWAVVFGIVDYVAPTTPGA